MVVRSRVWPDEGLPPAWPPPQRVPCQKVSGMGSTIFIAQAHSSVTAVGGHGAGFTGPCLPKEAWKETVGRGCQLRCHPVTSCVPPAQGGASRACRRRAWGFLVPSSQQTAQPQWTRPACWASGLGAGVSTCPGREDPGGGGSPRPQSWGGGKLTHGPLLSPSRLQPQHLAGLRSAESCS